MWSAWICTLERKVPILGISRGVLMPSCVVFSQPSDPIDLHLLLSAGSHVVRERPGSGFYIAYEGDELQLFKAGEKRGATMRVADVERRLRLRTELARACGVVARGAACRWRVLDAMSGWGVDGLTLAGLGCEVTASERSPIIAALNADLARRCAEVVSKPPGAYEVRSGDGWRRLDSDWDVVYLDPMFEQRNKSAKPNKRLQYLAEIAARDDRPLGDWIARAKRHSHARVVVKRRRKDPPVGTADWTIQGTSVRYDIYRGETPL